MLEGLYAGAVADALTRSQTVSSANLEQLISQRSPAIDALTAFQPRANVHILAEIKRASPSRGDIAEIAAPSDLATVYEAAGATGISVLTEGRKFKGSLEDLSAVRSAVAVPLLRKDFIANEYQLLEARAHGADLALLIVAGLDQETLIRLKHFTEQLGMTAFIETHDRIELERALETGAKFIGINARDLTTFETNRNLFGELAHHFPSDVIKVAESAVRDAADVHHYRKSGADVVLVGEALVTGNAASTLQSFLRNN
ncbi:MAG: indole-3-glycerol phosphate synthase TrpC [Rhodoluna sp.]|nr:indole-3-glycerol phosphate synthase TrpC [Rhodoluna sp.]